MRASWHKNACYIHQFFENSVSLSIRSACVQQSYLSDISRCCNSFAGNKCIARKRRRKRCQIVHVQVEKLLKNQIFKWILMVWTCAETSAMDDFVHIANVFPDKRLLDYLRSVDQKSQGLQEISDAFSEVRLLLSRLLLYSVFLYPF